MDRFWFFTIFSISFLYRLAKATLRGELTVLLKRIRMFRNFVKLSSRISLSLDQFLSADSASIRDAISEQMNDEDLSQNLGDIIEIFEEFDPDSTKAAIFRMVKTSSKTSFKSLIKLVRLRPDFLSDDELIAIFCETSIVGVELCEVLKNFKSFTKFARFLTTFLPHKFTPTFSQLYNSFLSKLMAEQLFQEFITRAAENPCVEWPPLLYQLYDLQSSYFPDLVSKKEIMDMVASEIAFYEDNRFIEYPWELVVDFQDDEFKELAVLLRRMRIFRDFVKISSNITLSYEQFVSTDSTFVRDAIYDQINENLSENLECIIEIFEEFYPMSAKSSVFHMVKRSSKTSLESLIELVKLRPNFLSDEELISIFCETTVTGYELWTVVKKFENLNKYSRILATFLAHRFAPNFAQLYHSLTSKALAKQLFQRFIMKAVETQYVDWTELLDQVYDMQLSLFSDLVSMHEVTAMVASEMLTFYAEKCFTEFPLELVVDNCDAEYKLTFREWEEIVAQKSQEFVDLAMPTKDDPSFMLAREVLNLYPNKQRSKTIKNGLNNIRIIEMCIEMGSQRIPATYRFCDPSNILREVAKIDKNYDRVQKCAELAKMLKLKSPYTKAMVYCAQEALNSQDYVVFESYIRKLKIVKGVTEIYHICKEAIEYLELAYLRNDLATCMLLNYPHDAEEILEMLDSIRCPQPPIHKSKSIEEILKPLVVDVPTIDHSFVDQLGLTGQVETAKKAVSGAFKTVRTFLPFRK